MRVSREQASELPHNHANYPELPPKYPQDGGELPAGHVDGVHDPVVPVDGHCVFDGLGLDG